MSQCNARIAQMNRKRYLFVAVRSVKQAQCLSLSLRRWRFGSSLEGLKSQKLAQLSMRHSYYHHRCASPYSTSLDVVCKQMRMKIRSMRSVHACIIASVFQWILHKRVELHLQGSRVRPIWSHVRPNFSRVRLKKNFSRTGASSHSRKQNKSLRDSESLSAVRQQTR